MSDTATQERRSALDEFAAGMPESKGELVPVQGRAVAVERHGAVAVEVRRDEGRIKARIKELAAMAGEEWFYRWPVKNKRERRTDWVEGLSTKGANALIGIYGNCRVYPAQVVDLGTHWRITAIFIDFETGTEYGRDFQQRKSGGTMGDDPERKLDIAFQVGESKALRNVIINMLQTYADFALSEAKSTLVDKIGHDIERYRRVTAERVAVHIDLGRVEAVLGRAVRDWLAPDIARVIAVGKAVEDGMATWNESFPPLKTESAGDEALDKFASAPSPATPPGADAVGADQAPRSAPAAPDPVHLMDARKEAIAKMLALATDPLVDLEDRLGNLDGLMPVWEDRLGAPAFVKTLFDYAAKVAKGELTAEHARRYLEALP